MVYIPKRSRGQLQVYGVIERTPYIPKRTEAELIHFGVKGMRWGVRKKTDESTGEKKTVKTRLKALGERSKNVKVGTIIKASAATTAFLYTMGPVALQAIQWRAAEKRDDARRQREDDEIHYLGIGKRAEANRKGVYNISTM